MTRENAV